ncbi:MAG: EAL domain-containing protein [Alphaproteobacteria bacterium]|nr:EAL domain-containing protein [Alphaproteobacteria bacterium]
MIKSLFSPIGGVLTQIISLSFICICLPLIAYLVYETGGTKLSWPYLMILPIALGAMIFKIPGGVLTGVIAALLLGPFMPLDTFEGITQSDENWILRIGFFVTIGGFIGALADYLDRERIKNDRLTSIDTDTGLTWLSRLPADIRSRRNQFQEATVCVIRLHNYRDVQAVFGYNMAADFSAKTFITLKENLNPKNFRLYKIGASALGVVHNNALRDAQQHIADFIAAIPKRVIVNSIPIPVLYTVGIATAHQAELMQQKAMDKALFASEVAINMPSNIATFNALQHESTRENLILMDDLYKDLSQGCLSIVYQPKLSLKDNMITGAEALLRWTSPRHGVVPPDKFIPLAEKAGLIGEITKWVLDKVSQELTEWRLAGIPIDMSINLSGNDLTDNDILNVLHDIPTRMGSNFNGIELELTETGLVKDLNTAIGSLRKLQLLGYKIAIDDFGTGYSSLEQFKLLSVDTVKIDKSFVQDFASSKDSQNIVNAAISICASRNVKVVAEGVETETVMNKLRSAGCHYAQGYFIAKPMSGKDFRAWLSEQAYPGKISA